MYNSGILLKSKKIIQLSLLAFIIILPFFEWNCVSQEKSKNSLKQAHVITRKGKFTFNLEIADTPQKRTTGLMHRRDISPDFGMLFIWQKNVRAPFWMKNTPTPLDILFIDEQSKIVFIKPNARPFTTNAILPPNPYRYVLEIVSGFVEKSGVATSDLVIFDI